jgi:SAM-dependent methyltransferase
VPEKSLTEEAEYEAILARLHHEVERGEGYLGGDGVDPFTLRRREAEALWDVSAERPFLSRPGRWGRLRGLLLTPAKGALRKLMRWYVEPLAADQRRFNAAVLRLADGLSERADAGQVALEDASDTLTALIQELRSRVDALSNQARLAVEIEERLTRLERRGRGPSAAAPALPAGPIPDYFAFESRMRGPTESVRERQLLYVEDFREAAPVLDLGSGRGEFLVLLREAGIEARGVDLDSDMVAYSSGEGLDVEQAGALEYLEGLDNGAVGGIFAAQLVEHLPPPALLRLLELAAAKLRPGGLLVAETINPLSPLSLRNYYADLTHAQPLVPETLELLARQSGFASVEVRFANEPEEKLAEPADPTIAANVRRLNELLFAPLDYAILART